jgi:hypothetical protein
MPSVRWLELRRWHRQRRVTNTTIKFDTGQAVYLNTLRVSCIDNIQHFLKREEATLPTTNPVRHPTSLRAGGNKEKIILTSISCCTLSLLSSPPRANNITVKGRGGKQLEMTEELS